MLLIGGKPVAKSDDGTIQNIENLPRCLAARAENLTNVFYVQDSPEFQYLKKGIDLYNEWKKTQQTNCLEQGIEQFSLEIALHREKGNQILLANGLHNAGFCYLNLGLYEKAIALFEEAIAIHREFGHNDHLFRDLGGLHEATVALRQNRLNAHSQESEIAEIDHKLCKIQEECAALIDRIQNPRKNDSADCVGQQEMGISTGPIGSRNIRECVTVVIHYPVKKVTIVAHLVTECDVKSLKIAMNRIQIDSNEETTVNLI